MTSDKMSGLILPISGSDMLTDLHRFGTARMEFTAHRGICGRRNIARQKNTMNLLVRIGIGNGGKERIGIRMQRIIENTFLISEFDHGAQIHDADFIGNIFNDR